jgi:Carboxypeptidase regulatory-like domain/TonB dependent receptor/TonB-dependent Receptor Plug Domain
VRATAGARFLLLLIVFSSCCLAQSPTGTVSGIIFDPAGRAIVGADVLIVSDGTGVQYSGKTNGEGIYVISNLPPGQYRIQVSNSGFKTIIKPDVVIHVQDALALNFTLPLGAASEVVTVEGGAPLVNTENASVGTVIDRKFVESLPLNGRSFNTLLQLTPGVVIANTTGGTPGQFSIAGQRTDANNFTVDGVSANFGVGVGQNLGQSGTGGAQAFSALGGTSSLVSVDALQEFRIETSSFAPEFGRSPGGQVILTTRAGTNNFHGGAFDYFRNTVMDANDWFANQAGQPRAPEHHNDFGAFIGGPIWREKTFFFASYEGARLDEPQTKVIQVPSLFARSSAPGSLAPFVNAYPQPNGQPISATAYTAPLTGNYSNRATLDAGSLRIDHTFNERFSIFGRYSDAPSATSDPVNSLSNLQTLAVDTQTVTLGANMSLGPRISNALRGNYSTQKSNLSFALDSFEGAVPINPSLLLGSLASTENAVQFFVFDTVPYFLGTFGRNGTKQMNFTDELAWSTGRHQLKFGGDYRGIFLNVDPFPFQTQYLSFTTKEFLTTGSVPFLFTGAFKPTKFLAQSLSLYVQDTWKITSRLSLTYGLRWELSPPPSARGRTTLAAWENTGNPAQLALAPAGTPLWNTTYGNFAPRAGIAYSLTQRGDFVVRAGGGIFYDLGVGSSADLAFRFPNLSFNIAQNISIPISDITPDLPVVSLQPPFGAVQGFSRDLALPRSYQWNVALEKSFGGTQAISATYVGQGGRDLLRQELFNRPNSNFASFFRLTTNDARSNYEALQLQYRRALSARLQALVNYTFSHSLDDASDDVAVALPGVVISGANDYASSDFDVRHSFSAALTYDLPSAKQAGPLSLLTKNWSIDTVIVARTGFPFNARITTPSALGGIGYTRPDRVSGQPTYLYGSQCASVFQGLGVLTPGQSCPGGEGLNPSAFSIPSSARQGTEGRNDIRGFGLTQVDLSIGRRFPIVERVSLQFRADAFNVLNHPNFANLFSTVDFGPASLIAIQMLNQGLGGLNSLFQEGGPRSLQLSLKLTF